MGRTVVEATIHGARASRSYEFLVDMGSAYLGLPLEEIEDLGLSKVPNGRRRFLTPEGVIESDTYTALGELRGSGFSAVATPFSRPVIGYMLLEDLLLKVNSSTGELEPDGEPGHVQFFGPV